MLYGVEREKGIILEGDSDKYMSYQYCLVPDISYSAITENVYGNGSVLAPMSQGILTSDSHRDSITYQPLIERYAAEYNLRPAFVAAIIRNESSFRTDAESSVGARGLMQLMPDTAEWIAGKIGDSNYSFDHLYDAETNIRYGCWYLNYLSKLFRGDAVLVSSAYHAGQTTVTRWLSDKGISSDGVTIPVDKLPDGPTKQYAGRVTTSYGIYEALLYPNESAEAAGAADGDIVSARAVRAGVANQ